MSRAREYKFANHHYPSRYFDILPPHEKGKSTTAGARVSD